jgi:hypothetical protein
MKLWGKLEIRRRVRTEYHGQADAEKDEICKVALAGKDWGRHAAGFVYSVVKNWTVTLFVPLSNKRLQVSEEEVWCAHIP